MNVSVQKTGLVLLYSYHILDVTAKVADRPSVPEELLRKFFHLQTVPCTDGEITLTGSSTQRAGMVRICTAGTWGKICEGSVDSNLAKVICSQLGFSPYGMTFLRHIFDCNVISL